MKKNITYLLLLLLFVSTSAFIVLKYNRKIQEPVAYHLKPGKAGATEEFKKNRQLAERYIAVVERNPSDRKNALTLAMLFIQEGRITGDHLYYDAAALHYINNILKMDPKDFEALTLKSLVQLSQHHFTDGLSTALQAQKQNSYNAFVYGLLVDGYVETGNYAEAVAQADKMVSIRPDIRSYARISYLREIHGDLPGAIEAMKMAADAGIPGEEATEWTRIQLARLYEEAGDLNKAESLCHLSLSSRPQYPYALALLGHLSLDRNNASLALAYYQKASAQVNDYGIKEMIVKTFKALNDGKRAEQANQELISGLSNDAKQGETNEQTGHYADKELAYAYLLANEPAKALDHAIAEYNRRPDNIDVNETLAWTYFKNGQPEKALPYLKVALKTNTRSPALLAHAAIIYSANKMDAPSLTYAQQQPEQFISLDPDLKQELQTILKQ